ncbi:MAG: glycosyltransferase [Verrucomicrobia bacterium]|nr:glycosyltransferase [Verrucomicrobiota bacterium]
MSPSFSVVTPSYNQGRYIRATVESVLGQNIPGLEYLVIDGGSTDETLEVLRSYGDRLWFCSERDHGTADAINKGFARARGDLLGWLNSDDVYYPGTLSRVIALFEAHPEVDVIYGRAHHVDAGGRAIDEYPTEAWSFERLLEHCIISQPAAFFRRRTVEKFGPLAEAHKYCVDYELWIRWAQRGAKFLYVPEFFAATRLHEAAKTVALRLRCHEDINDILVERLGYVPVRWLSNYAHIQTEQRVDRSRHELVFILLTAARCLLADLRWNKRISGSTVEMLSGWARHFWQRLRSS